MDQATYQIGLRTDKGQQRTHNEDAGAILELPGAEQAFVVCDGMGGLRSGDVASTETVRVVEETLQEFFSTGSPDPIKALGEAFRRANDHVNAINRAERQSFEDEDTLPAAGGRRESTRPTAVMGTTCVAGVVLGNSLYLAHAGDSRAYQWRRGHLTRLTEDHSFVAERVKAGDMTEAEAKVSRFRNMITKAIGIDRAVEPDYVRETLEPDDMLLVCSDGLTTMLEDEEIASLMNAPAFMKATPERGAQMLVDAANRKGGHDNITVLLLRFGGQTSAPPVLDMDAPAPARPPSPIRWILLGMLLLLVLLAALLFYPPSRAGLLSLLGVEEHRSEDETGRVSRLPRRDFARLVYDGPVRFADFLARGELLSYSPGVGIYFVAQASGKVALLDMSGTAVRSVANLEPMELKIEPAPSTRVFMTSDAQGNVYLSYTKRKVVEKQGPDGQPLAVIKGFLRPEAVAVDDQGNLYVIDYNEIKICRARLPGEKNARPSVYVTPTPEATPPPATPAATPKPSPTGSPTGVNT